MSRAFARMRGLSNVLGLLIALAAIFALFSALRPDTFPQMKNVETIARQTAIVATATIGMTFIIVSGGIDLAVGSVVALATVVMAVALRAGAPPMVALLLGVATGVLSGCVTGAFVSKLRIQPFIVTLGIFLIARGLAKGVAAEQTVHVETTWIRSLLAVLPPDKKWMILPPGVWAMLALAVLMAAVLRHTTFGRHVVAVGSNESAARLCGVPVGRVKFLVYVLGGVFTGLAGVMMFSRITVGDPTVAMGLELEVIAAAVIGGASLSGGQGTILGSLLGALIMRTISSGCSQCELPNWVQEIVTGAIIVGAVLLDRLRLSRRGA